MDEDEFARFHSSVKRGDIVGVCGFPGMFSLITNAALEFTIYSNIECKQRVV